MDSSNSPVCDILSISNRGSIPHARAVTCQNHLLSLNKGSKELKVGFTTKMLLVNSISDNWL